MAYHKTTTIDIDWYNAVEAVKSLTDNPKNLYNKSIKYYIDAKENQIKELEITIKLYQKVLEDIKKLIP